MNASVRSCCVYMIEVSFGDDAAVGVFADLCTHLLPSPPQRKIRQFVKKPRSNGELSSGKVQRYVIAARRACSQEVYQKPNAPRGQLHITHTIESRHCDAKGNVEMYLVGGDEKRLVQEKRNRDQQHAKDGEPCDDVGPIHLEPLVNTRLKRERIGCDADHQHPLHCLNK